MKDELYFQVFNKITEMIEELKQLQIEMEENYISAGEQTIGEITKKHSDGVLFYYSFLK